MGQARRVFAAAELTAVVPLGAILFSDVLPLSALAASAADTATTSPKVRELATSIAQEWLAEQGAVKSAAPPSQPAANSFEDYVNSDVAAIQDQIMALANELWLENNAGVIMHLYSQTQGVLLSLGKEEILMRLNR